MSVDRLRAALEQIASADELVAANEDVFSVHAFRGCQAVAREALAATAAQPEETPPVVFLRPPYRYEVSDHGPATIYDAIDVGWVARVKESLPFKGELAALIVDALNGAASDG